MWKRGITFVHFDVETAVVQTPRDQKIFRSACVKRSVGPSKVESEVANKNSSEIVYAGTNAVDDDEATTVYAMDHGSVEGKR